MDVSQCIVLWLECVLYLFGGNILVLGGKTSVPAELFNGIVNTVQLNSLVEEPCSHGVLRVAPGGAIKFSLPSLSISCRVISSSGSITCSSTSGQLCSSAIESASGISGGLSASGDSARTTRTNRMARVTNSVIFILM